MSSEDIEEIINVKVKALEEKIEGDLAVNNTRFEELVLKQNTYEEEIVKIKEENVNIVEQMKKDLLKSIDDGFLNNRKEFDKIFKENDKKVEESIALLNKRLDDIELVIKLGNISSL